jgi:adenylate cyclase class 2
MKGSQRMNFREIEVKFYIQDFKALQDRISVSGAQLIRPRVLERNLRLDTEDRSLQKEGRLLRIRQDDGVWITYKADAQVDGGLITRTEIEFGADDFEVAKRLFTALGYQVVVMYEKYRQVYKVGDVVVTLDELPLGNFVEVEGPNRVMIEAVAELLGLNWKNGIATNYLGLFEIVKAKRGFHFNDLTFTNFEDLSVTFDDLNVRPADE